MFQSVLKWTYEHCKQDWEKKKIPKLTHPLVKKCLGILGSSFLMYSWEFTTVNVNKDWSPLLLFCKFSLLFIWPILEGFQNEIFFPVFSSKSLQEKRSVYLSLHIYIYIHRYIYIYIKQDRGKDTFSLMIRLSHELFMRLQT